MTRRRQVMVAAVVATVLASGCSLKEVQTWFALRGHSITAQQAKDIADKVNAQSSAGCDANYADFCVPNNQTSVRCAGTDGAGPEIGPVRIVGWDHFGLDPDGDKRACESPPSATPTPVVSAPRRPTLSIPTTRRRRRPRRAIPGTGTSFMYVAASDADVIRKIDTVTLDVVATYDVGGPLGDGLAMIGTRLFYGAGDRQFMTIGMYDIATGENNRSYIGGVYEPLLRTSPALPGRLVVATTHTSPSTLYLYDVTGDSGVRLRQSSPHGAIGGNLKEVEISADGTRIWTAAGAPYVISEVRTSDLTLSGGSFETGAYPTATASAIVGGTELVAAGTASNRTAVGFNAASRSSRTPRPPANPRPVGTRSPAPVRRCPPPSRRGRVPTSSRSTVRPHGSQRPRCSGGPCPTCTSTWVSSPSTPAPAGCSSRRTTRSRCTTPTAPTGERSVSGGRARWPSPPRGRPPHLPRSFRPRCPTPGRR